MLRRLVMLDGFYMPGWGMQSCHMRWSFMVYLGVPGGAIGTGVHWRPGLHRTQFSILHILQDIKLLEDRIMSGAVFCRRHSSYCIASKVVTSSSEQSGKRRSICLRRRNPIPSENDQDLSVRYSDPMKNA